MVAKGRDHATRLGLVILLMGLGLAAPANAGGGPDARRERVEFDPATGRWVAIVPPAAGTPDGDFQIARQQLADRHFAGARRRLEAWLKRYGEGHELYPQALLRRAEALLSLREYYAAHQRLQEFLNEFGGTELGQEAVTYEFAIAESFLGGAKRRFAWVFLIPAEDVGLRILDDLSAHYPDYAERAIKTKADFHYRRSEYDLAEDEYARLQRDYPQSRYQPYAMKRSADAALASFGGIPYDDAPLVEAHERYTQYQAQFPVYAAREGVGPLLTSIDEQRAAKELAIGEYYERVKQLRAASYYYRSTREHWPESIAAGKAAARLRRLGVEG